MSKFNIVALFVLAVCGLFALSNALEKDWTYKLIQINWNTTNPDALQMRLHSVRVAPGVYGINGSFLIGVDAGDEYLVEARLTRSSTGSSDYGITPFSVPPTPLTKFINTHYKNFLMEDLKSCSTLPQIEGKWEPPLKKGEYHLNSCVITTDNFPTHMRPGMYKVCVIFTTTSLVAIIEVLVEVSARVL